MQAFDKVDVVGMREVEGDISKSKARVVKLDSQGVEFTGAINREKEKFDRLKAQAADINQDELAGARLTLRSQIEREAQYRIRRAEGGRKINLWKFQKLIFLPRSALRIRS